MCLCSYPTNGPVNTIAPDHHGCILQLHMNSSYVSIRRILSACTSVTVSSYRHPCILHLHPTIRLAPVSNVIFSKTDNLSKIAIYKLYLEVEVLCLDSTKFDYQRGYNFRR